MILESTFLSEKFGFRTNKLSFENFSLVFCFGTLPFFCLHGLLIFRLPFFADMRIRKNSGTFFLSYCFSRRSFTFSLTSLSRIPRSSRRISRSSRRPPNFASFCPEEAPSFSFLLHSEPRLTPPHCDES